MIHRIMAVRMRVAHTTVASTAAGMVAEVMAAAGIIDLGLRPAFARTDFLTR